MILNRPYFTSSFVPEIAAGQKIMAFGDFSYYWIADRQGRSFKRLNELFAATGQVGFLCEPEGRWEINSSRSSKNDETERNEIRKRVSTC